MRNDPPTDAEVESAARRFRAAIDAAGQEPWSGKYITFPRGACGLTAELLGRFLIERLGIVAVYVCQDGTSESGWDGSHAWLEWNGLTIDVTGDQFGWEAVMVTRSPVFHGRGTDHARHPVCLPHQADWWAQECGSLWAALRPHLAGEPAC